MRNEPPAGPPLGHWSILIVEDDPDDFFLTRTTLAEITSRKIDAQWASSYDLALKAIEQEGFDVLIVDYSLGAQTGLDLIRHAHATGYPAPMILLTGHDSYELDMQAMRAGATGFLPKAILTPALLERSIRYCIERRNIEQSLIQVNEQLVETSDELEQRVNSRTEELLLKNNALIAEINQRINLEAELAEVQRRLLDRSESERLELAQDLHDGPMQELYALSYEMASLSDQQNWNDREAVMAGTSAHIQRIISTLRNVAAGLRPPALAPFGLEKAIRSHAETIQPTHPKLKIDLDLDHDGQMLSDRTRLVLFRIYQMALTNVIRHAQADQVTIRLKLDEQSAVLEVADNGKGFVLPPRWYEFAREGHLGLAGAAERAEAIGATLHVESAPGQGTSVRVSVPRSER